MDVSDELKTWDKFWFIRGGNIHPAFKYRRWTQLKELAQELPKQAWDIQQIKIDALQSRLNIAVECLREACEELEFRMESNSEVTPSGNSGKHDKSVSAGFSILLRAREVLKQINPKGG
jgi:hypothetical protein